MPDPQTNGGLLIALDPKHAEELIVFIEAHGEKVSKIGKMVGRGEEGLRVEN